MKTLFNNWNVMRGIRLALGLVILVQAFIQRDMFIGLLAGFLLFTALANIGCCRANSCGVNLKKSNKKELAYEELDPKK